MKLLIINQTCGTSSTGKICVGIAKEYEEKGYEVRIAYGRNDNVPENCKKYAVRIGTPLSVKIHALATRLTDLHGRFSYFATKRFLKWAEDYNPDEVWLHNLHGYYINYPLLFCWLKSRPDMKIKWTLHDCWAFTGHCPYFSYADCRKWQTGCEKCIQKNEYPKSAFADSSKSNYLCKKKTFTGVKNMTLITPSKWLACLVKKSFLSDYPVEVVYNTIDKTVFCPRPSNLRQKYNIGKYMLLGVANVWERRKGLPDFLELRKMLPSEYSIVLVGLSDKQKAQLPDGIIGLKRTANQIELAKLYSAADVFLNLTYEDNYPTVNLEARACGTKIITYDTGGSPESAGADAIVVEQGNLADVYSRIIQLNG